MKKIILIIFVSLFANLMFSQKNATVDITDDIYSILEIAETYGYCSKLSNVKPYTNEYIKNCIDEILETLENKDNKLNDAEYDILYEYRKKMDHKTGFDPSRLSYRIENENEIFPTSIDVNDDIEGFLSAGLYQNSNLNSTGYEIWNNFNFLGDVGKHTSYRITAYMELTSMPLQLMGTYDIGYWWFDVDKIIKSNGVAINQNRYITKYRNNSVLPYSYSKHWSGSVYNVGNINACGLTGWPNNHSFGFGMLGDIHSSFFNNNLEIGIGRVNREWAAMDEGSSLVLNKRAQPFLAGEFSVRLFDWLRFSGLTGILENPNQAYVLSNAWYYFDEDGEINSYFSQDSFFFQNAYSIAMVDVDFKYLHFDFGSNSIWAKRLEFGYAYPIIDSVVYQNSIGDYDNLSLFADLKIKYPSIGSIWGSLYLDEVNKFNAKLFEQTRCMFAFQAGTKVNIPLLPFMSFSFRYTKVEPYCYTHTAIKTPWYSTYVAQSYTNNGESLGYYLDPNSDEFLFQLDTRPVKSAKVSLKYQLIRHGTDYGTGAVPGSNLYSEMLYLQYNGIYRDDLRKYFLRDGVYEWFNIVSLSGSYDFQSFSIPIQVFCDIGYVYQWFTGIDGEPGKRTPFHYINNSEYYDKNGVVFTLGVKLFAD